MTISLSIKYKKTILVVDLINDILLKSFNNYSILLKNNLDVAVKQLRTRDKVRLERRIVKRIRENKSIRLAFNSNLE